MRCVPSQSTFILLSALVAAAGCAADAKPDGANDDESVGDGVGDDNKLAQPVSLDDFRNDGRWSLRVNRTWDGTTEVTVPTQMLSEDAYDSTAQTIVHQVMVASGGVTVMVGSDPVAGSAARTSTATRLVYELGSGTFAGGRFLVWQGSKGLEAELTIYGSGRPIVESERGDLVRDP